MRKSSFSPEKVSEMASLYGAGESLKGIGIKFNANPQTICRLLKKAGVVIRPRGRPSKGDAVATEPVVPTVTEPAVSSTTDAVKVPTPTRVVSF